MKKLTVILLFLSLFTCKSIFSGEIDPEVEFPGQEGRNALVNSQRPNLLGYSILGVNYDIIDPNFKQFLATPNRKLKYFYEILNLALYKYTAYGLLSSKHFNKHRRALPEGSIGFPGLGLLVLIYLYQKADGSAKEELKQIITDTLNQNDISNLDAVVKIKNNEIIIKTENLTYVLNVNNYELSICCDDIVIENSTIDKSNLDTLITAMKDYKFNQKLVIAAKVPIYAITLFAIYFYIMLIKHVTGY